MDHDAYVRDQGVLMKDSDRPSQDGFAIKQAILLREPFASPLAASGGNNHRSYRFLAHRLDVPA